MNVSPLQFYVQHGIITNPQPYTELFDNLPADIDKLVVLVQHLMIHVFWAERMGETLTPERQHVLNERTISQKLSRIRAISDEPLTVARPLSQRLVGNCRDFSTLLCSILQHVGVPARARCGFATYFLPDHYEDHWVCEYWNEQQQRWILVDAQLDPFQQDVLRVNFDPLDTPRDQFITAGHAWRMCRAGSANPDQFGIFNMHGLAFIRGNVIRDFLALNKIELLPWDDWGLIVMDDQAAASDDVDLIDRIAVLTTTENEQFDTLRALFTSDPRLSPAPDWQPDALPKFMPN